jgi:hypothetical protein
MSTLQNAAALLAGQTLVSVNKQAVGEAQTNAVVIQNCVFNGPVYFAGTPDKPQA